MTKRATFLASLSKPQVARLNRHECWLCDQALDRTLKHGCAATHGPRCATPTIIARAADCLNASEREHIRVSS